ncbi:hypothetical protein AMECASPLE_032370 [Ameca splendens]|uniref:Uncharacterized protein n=1 Tax=Ameca splendens TaxID=208324 RepID=A0ABV0Y6H2_9TELE
MDPPLQNTLRSPFLNRGTTTRVCQSSGTAPDVHVMLQSRVNQHNPTTSRALRYAGRISSTPGDLSTRDWRARPNVPKLLFLSGGIEEVFEVLRQLTHNVPS